MNKLTGSFQFDTVPAHSRPLRPTDAAAGVLLLAGIWGLLWQCLRPEPMPGLLGLGALAALGLAAGLLLRWDRKWQRAALCGALLLLLAAGILLRSHIGAALAGLGDLWGQWRFQQTGRYTPPYVGAGSVWWLLPMGAVTGLATGLVLRQRWRIWPAAVCAVYMWMKTARPFVCMKRTRTARGCKPNLRRCARPTAHGRKNCWRGGRRGMRR